MRSQLLDCDAVEGRQVAYLADFIVFGGYVSNEGDGGLLHSDGTPHGLWHHGSRPSVIECTCRAIVLVQNPFEGFKNVVLRDYVAPLCLWQQGSLLIPLFKPMIKIWAGDVFPLARAPSSQLVSPETSDGRHMTLPWPAQKGVRQDRETFQHLKPVSHTWTYDMDVSTSSMA